MAQLLFVCLFLLSLSKKLITPAIAILIIRQLHLCPVRLSLK